MTRADRDANTQPAIFYYKKKYFKKLLTNDRFSGILKSSKGRKQKLPKKKNKKVLDKQQKVCYNKDIKDKS